MESLALAAAIIVSPAMFGGPLALLISLWKPRSISKFRRFFIYLLSAFSTLIGLFLIVENISTGARNVGILGITTGVTAIWRVRKYLPL
jgi:ABC-type transport system involved in cytochrome c biogenesis permease subunit